MHLMSLVYVKATDSPLKLISSVLIGSGLESTLNTTTVGQKTSQNTQEPLCIFQV